MTRLAPVALPRLHHDHSVQAVQGRQEEAEQNDAQGEAFLDVAVSLRDDWLRGSYASQRHGQEDDVADQRHAGGEEHDDAVGRAAPFVDQGGGVQGIEDETDSED